jgi:hypothetical protein
VSIIVIHDLEFSLSGVICQYVIVIELDKMHVILSIFPYEWTKSGLLTLFTYMAFADWSFCSLYLFSFYALSYILYIVYL